MTQKLTFHPNRGQGKATKLTPTAGFSSAALAELFPSNSPRKHKKSIIAIIVGSVVGSLALLGVVSMALYLNRKRIRRYFNGNPDPTPEIGESKPRMEIMDKETFWELDAQQDRRPSMRDMIINGVREGSRGFRLPGSSEGQNQVAELEVKKSVAELDGGKKEADENYGGEKSGAVLAVKRSAESLERKKEEKDGRCRSNSNQSGDVEIEVVRMDTREHKGSVHKEGGYF